MNAAELLREPGSRRHVETDVDVGALDLDAPNLVGPLHVDAILTSTLDGIVAEATFTVALDDACSRCLVSIEGDLTVAATDTFAAAGDGDAPAGVPAPSDHSRIDHGQLDLASFARDSVLLAIPDAPLCKPDCAGLCPLCGVDHNVETCDCATEVGDDRWAALDALRSDAPGSGAGS